MPAWILLVGGVGIVVGLVTYGYKVMATIGTKITELTPSRGFAATLGASATVVLASGIGLPISTTPHPLVGAVLGVGLARGLAAINLRIVATHLYLMGDHAACRCDPIYHSFSTSSRLFFPNQRL